MTLDLQTILMASTIVGAIAGAAAYTLGQYHARLIWRARVSNVCGAEAARKVFRESDGELEL